MISFTTQFWTLLYIKGSITLNVTIEVTNITTPESQVDRAANFKPSVPELVFLWAPQRLAEEQSNRRLKSASVSCRGHGCGMEGRQFVGPVPQFSQVCNRIGNTRFYLRPFSEQITMRLAENERGLCLLQILIRKLCSIHLFILNSYYKQTWKFILSVTSLVTLTKKLVTFTFFWLKYSINLLGFGSLRN